MERQGRHALNAANAVTALRMGASLVLLGLVPGTAGFLAVYTLAGLTDALDGWLARRMGTAGDFGARLDSAADLLFFSVLLLRLAPGLWRTMPPAIGAGAAGILLVRLAALAVSAIRFGRPAALHTRLNKLTGAALFLLPYVLAASAGVGYCAAVCALALAASLEELTIQLTARELRADRRSILDRER